MVIALVAVGVAIGGGWLWIRSRRIRRTDTPLAGYDTGVHSAWRTPGGRFFGPRRGF